MDSPLNLQRENELADALISDFYLLKTIYFFCFKPPTCGAFL
jgi:hypothetical protein